ncbi:2-oxo-4-hydroxy-4-carboxy-5-ureidoimidazoline decarboxylase [Serratia aquatilis]|uniref:2-oxo-4-hydroxy-4-carboxy-5-ureidoimidazoline decarboxylase n=1 Tax=Serratia aquatilis TaxID=1737515 RepID=A0ABV6EDN4_9GAMM
MFNKKLFASILFITSSLSFSAFSAEKVIYIDELNSMSQEKFEQALGNIFEKAPWVIQQAGEKRPYKGFVDLYEGIIEPLKTARPDVLLALIQSHPNLACKGIRTADITAHSQSEQSGAGLDQCTQEEADLLLNLNKDYQKKFGFPFMLAIKGYNKTEIIEQFQKRINNDKQQEFDGALQQVYKVVLWRLLDTVK